MKYNSVIGIDPSSKGAHITFMPLVDANSWSQTFIAFPPKGKWTPSRCLQGYELMRLYFQGVGEAWRPRIYMEAPIMSKASVQSMLVQAFVSGAIQAAAESVFSESIELVPPSSWKKAIIGNGAAGKPAIKEFVIDSGLLSDGYAQDFYDSCAIALYGLQRAPDLH